jgi:hypothetical protein
MYEPVYNEPLTYTHHGMQLSSGLTVRLDTPEQRLCCAMLTDAMALMHGTRQTDSLLEAKRTSAWFESDRTGPCSLIWVCHNLGLDPEAVRNAVLTGRSSRTKLRLPICASHLA